MTEEDDAKSLRKLVLDILSTTEEMKSSIDPLIRGQERAIEALASQGEAISALIEHVFGTREEHKKMADKLEMVMGKFGAFKHRLDSHESSLELLGKRLTLVEKQQVDELSNLVESRKPLSKAQLQNLDELINLHPDDFQLVGLKALALKSSRDSKAAVEWIDGLIAKDRNQAYLWWMKGVVLDNDEEALKCFDKSEELLGNKEKRIPRHNVSYSKAMILEKLSRFEEALTSIEKAIECESTCEYAWSEKGDLLLKLNRVPESLSSFEKALELNSEFAWAWHGKGQALAVLGPDHYEEAAECFDNSARFGPTDSAPHFAKAELLLEMDRHAEGLSSVEKGLSLDAEDACAWCIKGMLLGNLKEFPKAVDSFDKAIEHGPPAECIHVRVFKGEALIDAGRISDARNWLKCLDERKMEDAETLNRYAWSLYEIGECVRGVEAARRLVGLDSSNPAFLDTLACNLVGNNSDSEALQVFQKAISLRKSDDSISWGVFASLCDRMGLREEADMARTKAKPPKPDQP